MLNFELVITPASIRNILDATRIEEVIGDYVTLRKRGANYTGLCPFHNERTPSFSVSAVKGIYKCFGCGKGGDAVNFLMEHEHFTYPEALRYLAKKFNVAIEETETDSNVVAQQKEQESLYIVNKFAQEYFHERLMQSDEGVAVGLSYFHERKFSSATIQKFGLGYAMDSPDSFYQVATRAGYSKELLLSAGLIGENENRVYDFFRGRVIFPIYNLSGKVIAFAGRVMKKNDKTAKYINSKETEVYNKSKTLYAIHLARESIRHKDECLLTEGYADVITMHQFGFENTVASSGTSLTHEQVRLIKRFTTNLTFIYDGDTAGIKAALRGLDIALEEGMNVKICIIPDGEDPDSYLNKYGAAAMQHLLMHEAKGFLHFQAKLLLDEAGNDPARKSAAIREIIQSLSLIIDPITRGLYIKELSKLVDMNESLMIREVNKARARYLQKNQPQVQDNAQSMFPVSSADIVEQRQLTDTELVVENDIIKHLIRFGNYIWEGEQRVADKLIEELSNLHHYWLNERNQRIFKLYYDAVQYENFPSMHDLMHHENEELAQYAREVSSEKYLLSPLWEEQHGIRIPRIEETIHKTIEDMLNRIYLCNIRNLIKEVQQELKTAEQSKDWNGILRCLDHKKKLDAEHVSMSKDLGMTIALPRN